jgi:hypothetical protein
MITPQNALKFSMWLAVSHPEAFQAVAREVVPVTSRRGRQALGSVPSAGQFIPGSRGRMKASHVRGRFGSLGDDAPMEEVTVSSTYTPDPIDAGWFESPTLQAINIDMPATTFDLSSAAESSDTSGGFWSSLGSGLSSIGSGLAGAVGAVAKAVTNPAVLAGAAGIAATVIKANAGNSQQAQQLAILQSQQQRTLTGAGAQPIRYVTDPATGRTVPYYYNAATGQYQPTQPGFLNSLMPGAGGLSQYLPYILLGGGVLVLALVMRKST